MDKYKFDCGCEIDIVNHKIKECDGLPSLHIDFDNLNENCYSTWELFSKGTTKGVFQLEKNLGKVWSKKIKPTSIEDISALISLIRPGCLDAKLDGKNMTQHYVERKFGLEEVKYIHPALESILGTTCGVLCVEENTMISNSNGIETSIKNINKNDRINSININTYECEYDVCHDIKQSRIEDGYELLLENGYRVILTKDHKVYTQNGWKELQNLDQNLDVVSIIVNQTKTQNTSLNESWLGKDNDVAYFCGQLYGDGSSGFNISSGTLQNHKVLFDWLKNTFVNLNISEYFHCRSWYISLNDCNKTRQYNRKTQYRDFIERFGLDKTNNDKNIPNIIMTGTDEVRRAFVAGVFDSDGHSGNSCCHIASNNPTTINNLRKLFSLDGISTWIDKEYKHIHIINVDKFKNLFGQYIKIKPIICNYTGKSYGSYPKYKFREYIKTRYKTLKECSTKTNIPYNTLKGHQKFHDIYTVNKAGLTFGDCTFMRIKGIKNVGTKQFYSISVQNNRNFIGNGIILKNCYQEQAIKIASIIAGLNLQQADALRKAMGKKDAKLMKSLEQDFVDGCEKTGLVTREQGVELFDNIQKSNKYSFNKCLNPYTTTVYVENNLEYVEKKLIEVKIGDRILCPKDNHSELCEIKNIYHNGKRHLYKVFLGKPEWYRVIECSIEHQFLTPKGKFSLLEILKKRIPILCFNGSLNYIDRIEYIGYHDTMDIEIDNESHVFFANGIATSNSHGVGYAKTSYATAYTKTHFPLHFCCSYLYYAREKMKPQEEIDEIIVDSKNINVDILTPDLRLLLNGDAGDFSLFKGKINFGVRSIKGCGDSHVQKLIKLVDDGEKLLDKTIDKWNWIELLFLVFLRINKTVTNGVISVGGVSHLGISRQAMLHDYNLCLTMLDNNDLDTIQQNIKNIYSVEDAIEILKKKPKIHKSRLNKYTELGKGVKDTPFSTEDSPAWIADKEMFYLGSSISCLKCETVTQSGNTTCKEFNSGKNEKNMTICGEIKSVRDFIIKNGNLAGQKMCFGTIEDSTGRTDFSLSPKQYTDFQNELFKGNIVLILGGRGNNDNFRVNKVITT